MPWTVIVLGLLLGLASCSPTGYHSLMTGCRCSMLLQDHSCSFEEFSDIFVMRKELPQSAESFCAAMYCVCKFDER